MVAGRRAALEAVRAGRAREILVARGSRSTPALSDLLDAATERRVPVREASRRELDAFDRDHHGVVALVEAAPELGERHLASWPFGQEDLVVVLDGITDPQNLGAAARAAEAAGAVMLVTRIKRAAAVTPAAVKASAGALLHLPHARVANIARALERLKEAGFFVVGLDEGADATVYERLCPPGRVALVVGSEGEGLSRLTGGACDELIRLPMRGQVASLNAAASLAAVLYAFVLPSRRS
jgi:23S rRNA (guanosine2251-2'-O)-methyltransferase